MGPVHWRSSRTEKTLRSKVSKSQLAASPFPPYPCRAMLFLSLDRFAAKLIAALPWGGRI